MSEIVLFITITMVLLLVVSFLSPIAERLSVPNTILLAILGVALGLAGYFFDEAQPEGVLGEILQGVLEPPLSADAILAVFLPPLLFTAGLTIDVRLVLNEMAAVLLLAVGAVFVSTAVTGLALAQATDVGLIACLLLGAVVATTDPAAVIGVFRDLGAPRRLTALISGESTFNDAAAIALFTILLDGLLRRPDLNFADGMLILLVDFLGGVGVGFVAAWITCSLLRWLFNLPLAEITVSVGLAYLSYILAQVLFDVSGVVAVVVAAMTFSVLGPVRLSPGSWEKLLQTWQQLEFWANSLIFVLAAMLASRLLPGARLHDLFLLAILIVAAFVARALVLYLFLPLLSTLRLTQPVQTRYKTVILWGGLRGAVTLALALSIGQTTGLSPEVRHFVTVLATGYVLFTLFVQAPLLRPLIRFLGLNQLTPEERSLRDGVIALSKAEVRSQIEDVTRDYGFEPETSEALFDNPQSPMALPTEINTSQNSESSKGSDSVLSDQAAFKSGLVALANREKELYLKHFSDGTISRTRVARLVASADRMIDRTRLQGEEGYVFSAHQAIKPRFDFHLAAEINRLFGWSGPLAKRIADRFEGLLIMQLVVREQIRFNRRAIPDLLGDQISDGLDKLLAQRFQGLADSLAAVDLQYPKFTRSLRQSYLARAALRLEWAAYKQRLDESLISREVFRELDRDLARRWRELERQPRLDLGLGVTEMVSRVKVFSDLNQVELEQVAQRLRSIVAVPGQRILKKGDPGSALYFIVAGQVEVALPTGPIRLGAGDLVGEMALLLRQPRSANVTAIGFCHLLSLDKREFHRVIRMRPELKEKIQAVAKQRLETNAPR